MYTLVIKNQENNMSFNTHYGTINECRNQITFAKKVLEQQLNAPLVSVRGLGRVLQHGEISIETFIIVEFIIKKKNY